MNKAFSTYTSPVGWKAVTGIQFLFPVCKCIPDSNCDFGADPEGIIIFTYFIPDSPRWLLSKDRTEEAIESLRILRPKSDSEDGTNEAELSIIRNALQEHVHKGKWMDLVRGANLRRTALVCVFYFYQQVGGYSPWPLPPAMH